jgi:hypothetical protein
MAFKTNYQPQRSERARIQNEHKQEKLQKRQEAVVKRKAIRAEPAPTDVTTKEN